MRIPWFGRKREAQANTTVASNPASWLIEQLGGTPSYSGAIVNAATALTHAAVWHAVTKISGDIARLKCQLYQRTGEEKARATDHPYYRLVHSRPNEECSAFQWRRNLVAQLLVYGNSGAYIDRSGGDVQLWALDWSRVQVDRNRSTKRLLYRVTTDAGQIELDAAEVLHFRGLSLDGIQGIPFLRAARQTFGTALATNEWVGRFFSGNGVPPIVLKVPNNMPDEQIAETLRNWQKSTALDSAHKATYMREAMDVKTFQVNARDSMLVESQQQVIRAVASYFNLPSFLLNDIGKSSTYSNRQDDQQAYLDSTLAPILAGIEAELNFKLLDDDPDLFFEHQRFGVLDLNVTEQANLFKTNIDSGVNTVNECRRALNLPPVPWGDDKPQPAQLAAPPAKPEGGDGDE